MKKTISFSVDESIYSRVVELALKNHGGSASEFARHATFRAIGQYKGRPGKKEVEEVVISGADGHPGGVLSGAEYIQEAKGD